jgi:hypothetical protein
MVSFEQSESNINGRLTDSPEDNTTWTVVASMLTEDQTRGAEKNRDNDIVTVAVSGGM